MSDKLAKLSDETSPSKDRESILLAKEIVQSRTAWTFKGICAKGTNYPDGTKNKDSGRDVTGSGSGKDPQRYYKSALHFDPSDPLLFYAANIHNKAYPKDEESNSVCITRSPSITEGVDEVVIAGKCATEDNRSISANFILIQRLDKDQTDRLFNELRRNPNFFEIFFKESFPGMDSSNEGYDGLYRYLADRIILLEQKELTEISQKYPATPTTFPQGGHKDPYITSEDAREMLKKGTELLLSNPTGSGTIQDFAPIKAKLWSK